MKLSILSLVVFAPLHSLNAVAQDYVPPADLSERGERARYLSENAFDMVDADRDGRLTLAEWRNKEWLTYSEFDHDRNGLLDATELKDMQCGGLGADTPNRPPLLRWCLSSAEQEFRRLSPSGRGISADSLASQARRGFEYNDLNRDGFVTREEQQLAIRRRR